MPKAPRLPKVPKVPRDPQEALMAAFQALPTFECATSLQIGVRAARDGNERNMDEGREGGNRRDGGERVQPFLQFGAFWRVRR